MVISVGASSQMNACQTSNRIVFSNLKHNSTTTENSKTISELKNKVSRQSLEIQSQNQEIYSKNSKINELKSTISKQDSQIIQMHANLTSSKTHNYSPQNAEPQKHLPSQKYQMLNVPQYLNAMI